MRGNQRNFPFVSRSFLSSFFFFFFFSFSFSFFVSHSVFVKNTFIEEMYRGTKLYQRIYKDTSIMNTLWRIVLLFFLSKQVLTYRNEYFLIVSLIFKTSFVKNSISMKTWTLLLFMHVIPNTIRCISLRFDSFQILRIEKNRNLYKFCATSSLPLLHIYLYPSWQQAPTDQLWTGRIAAEGVVPLRIKSFREI